MLRDEINDPNNGIERLRCASVSLFIFVDPQKQAFRVSVSAFITASDDAANKRETLTVGLSISVTSVVFIIYACNDVTHCSIFQDTSCPRDSRMQRKALCNVQQQTVDGEYRGKRGEHCIIHEHWACSNLYKLWLEIWNSKWAERHPFPMLNDSPPPALRHSDNKSQANGFEDWMRRGR